MRVPPWLRDGHVGCPPLVGSVCRGAVCPSLLVCVLLWPLRSGARGGLWLGSPRRSPVFSSTDVDECSDGNGGCEDQCSNTVGGFYCRCPAGHQLQGDGRTCQGRSRAQPTIAHGCPPLPGRAGPGVASSSVPRAALLGAPVMGPSLPSLLAMPLGRPRASESEAWGAQRTCCGWRPPWGLCWGNMRWGGLAWPVGPGTSSGGGRVGRVPGRACDTGGHRALTQAC